MHGAEDPVQTGHLQGRGDLSMKHMHCAVLGSYRGVRSEQTEGNVSASLKGMAGMIPSEGGNRFQKHNKHAFV